MPLLILDYHHIDAAYDCSMYYQLSNLFCLCPGQQATTCSASSTSMYKITAGHEAVTPVYSRAITLVHLRVSDIFCGRL